MGWGGSEGGGGCLSSALDWTSGKGRRSLDLTLAVLLPASQPLSSCPVKAARGPILISRLNVLITSDWCHNLSHLFVWGQRKAGGVLRQKCTRKPFLFFKMVDSGTTGAETAVEKHLWALNILCRGFGIAWRRAGTTFNLFQDRRYGFVQTD